MVRNLKELGSFMQRIVKRLMNNQNLLKLLYYTDKDPLSQSDISDDTIRKEIYEDFYGIPLEYTTECDKENVNV